MRTILRALLVLGLAPALASANILGLPSRVKEKSKVEETKSDRLKELLELEKTPSANNLLQVITQYDSDDEKQRQKTGKTIRIIGRDKEAAEFLNIFARMSAKVPLLMAPPGAKSATVLRAMQMALAGEYPDHPAFHRALDQSHWITVTAGRFIALATANNSSGRMASVDSFFQSLKLVEKKLKSKIFVIIDQFHTLDSDMVEAILKHLETASIGGTTDSSKFSLAFKDNPALMKRIAKIPVTEFSDEKSLEILKQTWIPEIERHYGVNFTERALNPLLKLAMVLNPDGGKIDGGYKFAMDLAINTIRIQSKAAKDDKIPIVIEEPDVYEFFKTKTGYPVNPFNPEELKAYLTELDKKIGSEIVGQERMRKDVLELFQDVIIGSKKNMGVIALLGPTGTGKSQIAKLLAKYGFDNPRALLRLDMTEYQSDDPNSMNKLFGAVGGLVTSDTRQGMLCDFFDDPSQGKYGGVILIDEVERGNPKVWERLMEFLDNGSFVGGDGIRRFANRHIVIMTSNRGDKILFPNSIQKWTSAQLNKYVAGIGEPRLKHMFQSKLSGDDSFEIPTPVLNRVDRFTVASPLLDENTSTIVANLARMQSKSILNDSEVTVILDPAIEARLGKHYYNIIDGARPVERGVTQFFNIVRERLQSGFIHQLRGKILELRLNAVNEAEGFAEAFAGQELLFKIELPKVKLDDPLMDPDFNRTVARLKEILPKMVKGQEDAIERTTDAIISWLSMPLENRKPLGFFWVGPTGVGKTELAKAISLALFETDNRAEVIPFGAVSNEHALNQVIGSPPGTTGSNEVRELEKALRNMPDGGVLIFDEASNMGADYGTKEALFKRLYHPFEEANWTSAATGEKYDLGKYIIVLTGNDGEEYFKGTNSDEIRAQTWKNKSKPVLVRRMLEEKGVPQAFINRMADVIMFKPLTHEIAAGVAEKMVSKIFKRYTDRGIEIQVEPDFFSQFGDLFYTADKGGRSIRDVADYRLNTVIASALSQLGPTAEDKRNHTIKIRLNTILPTTPYFTEADHKPKIEFMVEVFAKDQIEPVASETRDFTNFASLPNRLPKEQALQVARHEAGHAVVNDPLITGRKLTYVTILGDETKLGFALYDVDDDHPVYLFNRETAINHLSQILGGQAALVMAGYPPNSGWSNDLQNARDIAEKLILDWGLDPTFLGIRQSAASGRKLDHFLLSEKQKEILAGKIEDLLAEGLQRAQENLLENWELVEQIVAHLMETGFISEAQFKELRAQYPPSNAKTLHPGIKEKSACARLLMKVNRAGGDDDDGGVMRRASGSAEDLTKALDNPN